tara:strand:- start:124 stop:924 length:801 start_codon:yes stop_codon:yes gene_type:complete
MLKLKKSLGQNLLVDKNIINKILSLTNINNKNILEIGPGTGILTGSILEKKPKKLLLVEKDKRLCDILNSKLDKFNNYKIYNEDILRFDLNSNFKSEIVFGNLPYNISTQILAKLIKFDKLYPQVEKIIFMFQKEVADRILAKPGNNNYSRITILVNLKLDIIQHFKVSKECFFPSPKIDSKIIAFKPKTKVKFKIKNIENLERITQIFFSGRRKMINKPFSRIFKNYKEVAEFLKINLNKRPSELSCENFYEITEQYEKMNSGKI